MHDLPGSVMGASSLWQGSTDQADAHQRQEALQRLAAGETYAELARTYSVGISKICRLAASRGLAVNY
jgi:Mor family transcriptional regulator